MDDALREFMTWLKSDLTHFVSLIEEGSVASGDPWQEGFSDHDLQIVVAEDMFHEMQAVYAWLEKHPLGDTYLVSPHLLSDYLRGDTINDLSLKFRATTLAGRKIIKQKQSPDRDKSMKAGYRGLLRLTGRLERRWLNLSHWSDDYARHKNYEIFKSFFVHYAAWYYGRTGDYPVQREDIAHLIGKPELAAPLLSVTNGIATATKKEQKQAIESAVKIIRFCLK